MSRYGVKAARETLNLVDFRSIRSAGTNIMKITKVENNGYDGSGYSPEELAALEEYFQRYSKTVSLYEELIQLEIDPVRKQRLQLLLVSLCEDNK